jgi:long-chain fatty acid transport protein
LHTPIGFFYSHQFSPSIYAGIGVTNPFGLGLEWSEDFPGRSISYNTDLKSFYISPVFTYKLLDEFSISAGVDIVLGSVLLERYVRLFDSEGSPGYEAAKSSIKGNSEPAYGFTASMMYQTENLGLGFLYRHSVKNNLNDADATFTYLDNYATPVAQANLKDQKVNASLTFPSFFAVGLYYKFLENLGAEFDFFWYNWSVFDQLVFDFEELPEVVVPENYQNSLQLRLGVHYDLGSDWQFRVGYIFDQTPQPIESVSPLLPDNDRHDFSFGVGYESANWKFDIGYMLVEFGERSTVENGEGKNHDGFDGNYSSVANLLFFGIGYHFE